MIWKYCKETSTALPSLRSGEYVISIRTFFGTRKRIPLPFLASNRPSGGWITLGEFETPERAISACEEHNQCTLRGEFGRGVDCHACHS